MQTKFYLSDDDITVESVQDVEPSLDHAKLLRDQPQHGRDFHHKWHLPNVMIERFYLEYAGEAAPPMNAEFWAFVDKKMNDPNYAKFRTDNPSNPLFLGYRK